MYDLRSLDGTPLAIGPTRAEVIARYSYPGALHHVTEDLGAKNYFSAGPYARQAGLRHDDNLGRYNVDCYAEQVRSLAARYRAGELPTS